jgi:hypothetical protein
MNRTIAIVPLLLAVGGCWLWPVATNPPPPPVGHVVICWLKNPRSDVDAQALIAESQGFVGVIPGLTQVTAGRALPSTRPAVDSSYDVAVVMMFKDAAALEAYEAHPEHVAAVQRTLRPLVERLVIYDFVEAQQRRGHRK